MCLPTSPEIGLGIGIGMAPIDVTVRIRLPTKNMFKVPELINYARLPYHIINEVKSLVLNKHFLFHNKFQARDFLRNKGYSSIEI